MNKFLKENQLVLISEFPILYSGWECDGKGYLCKDKSDKFILILTSHGYPYCADKQELLEKLEEYEEVIKLTRNAYNSLT